MERRRTGSKREKWRYDATGTAPMENSKRAAKSVLNTSQREITGCFQDDDATGSPSSLVRKRIEAPKSDRPFGPSRYSASVVTCQKVQ